VQSTPGPSDRTCFDPRSHLRAEKGEKEGGRERGRKGKGERGRRGGEGRDGEGKGKLNNLSVYVEGFSGL
jgi:hypothetical protein